MNQERATPVISVQNLTKVYRLFQKPQDRLKHMLMWRLGRPYGREFRALEDITLEIERGETVGIVGRNGSGKSTLLQVIAGTLRPTSGSVTVRGRIAALLELGSGFNFEYTGRENIYMNAAVLGLDQQQIDERFDSIVSFADLGEFIDQPVKTLSSGMCARLAFSVAIHVEPEILIVDETLSVGDEAFQRKCFSRIETMKKRGATILFVSHSAASVIELCDRAVLLEKGRKLLAGAPKTVVAKYQKLLHTPQNKINEIYAEINDAANSRDRTQVLSGGLPRSESSWKDENESVFDPNLRTQSLVEYFIQGARLHDPHIETPSGERVNILTQNQEFFCCYEIEFLEPVQNVRWGNLFKTVNGLELGGLWSHSSTDGVPHVHTGKRITAKLGFKANLAPGTYFMNCGVMGMVKGQLIFLHRLVDAVIFKVHSSKPLEFCGPVDFRSQPAAAPVAIP